ncbi:hypothetical protein [Streptomyces sp. NPDC005507]|uniref:hypothetical protein n=1 Tax=unclassified Streptomyces TaxID=2593676 RepID=UPI0033B9C629
MKGSAESISAVDLQVLDLSWFGARFGQRAQWSRLMQGPVRPMPVVEGLELAQPVEELVLVP